MTQGHFFVSAVLHMSRRQLDKLWIALFVGFLLAPSIDSFIRPEAVLKIRLEMRKPAPLPEWKWTVADIGKFPQRFDLFFADSFGLRDLLLRAHNALLWFVFHVSPTNQLVLGQAGWVFHTGEDSVAIARGLNPFSVPELEAWRRALQSRRDWCRAHGLEFVIAFGPSKEEIYPEYYPIALNRVGPTRLRQLMAWMSAHSDVAIVDLRPPILAEKARDKGRDWVYYPLGTHWSDRGVYAAYSALLARLHEHHPEMTPLSREDLEYQLIEDQGDSWANRLYLDGLLSQENRIPVRMGALRWRWLEGGVGDSFRAVTEHEDKTLPRLLMYHDSFGEPVRKYMARHFSHAVFVWDNAFDPATIEAEKPDVVMQLFVERVLAGGVAQLVSLGDTGELAAAFAASKDVLFSIDPTAATPNVELRGRARVTSVAGGFELSNSGDQDMILLPLFEFAKDADTVLRIAVKSPSKASLVVFYKTQSVSEYNRSNTCRIELAPGENTMLVPLLEPRMAGRLMIRIGGNGERFTIRGLEVRAVPR